PPSPPVEQNAPPPPPAAQVTGTPAPEEQPVPPPERQPPPEPVSPGPNTERVKASPLARKIAEQLGIDLAQVHGTGPGGRIIESDVETFRERGPAAPAPGVPEAPAGGVPAAAVVRTPPAAPTAPAGTVASERPLTPMRKTIARRLTESKQTIPHFYLTADVDVE